MTSLDHIWINANPECREQIRRANEARAAAYYGAWRAAVGFFAGGLRRLAGWVARVRREHRTHRELSALSDRQLQDIGLWRSEIPFVAQATAAEPITEITLADLPRIRSSLHGGDATEAPVSDARRARRAPWVAKAPKAGVRRAA